MCDRRLHQKWHETVAGNGALDTCPPPLSFGHLPTLWGVTRRSTVHDENGDGTARAPFPTNILCTFTAIHTGERNSPPAFSILNLRKHLTPQKILTVHPCIVSTGCIKNLPKTHLFLLDKPLKIKYNYSMYNCRE